MTWSVARDYAAFNPAADELMRLAGWPYVLLRPPAVSRPLLVLADQTRAPELDSEFRRWAASPDATVVDAEAVRGRAGSEIGSYYRLPEREELLRCKWFSLAAQTPVAMYAASTFGAMAEFEWGWQFAPGVERALVMVRRQREVHVVQRRWLFRRKAVRTLVNEAVILEFTPHGVAERPHAGAFAVFEEAAKHLGVHAPGGFFRPHQRGFDWRPYHVTGRRKREPESPEIP